MHHQDETKVQNFNTNCNQCNSYDFNTGSVYNHGWGSGFLEVGAWGGHQGGGMMGCYYHGKFALSAYQSMISLDGDAANSKGWGSCGEFQVTRPSQADSVNTDGCDGAHTNCEDGTRSIHGWHSNIVRVKKTAGADIHGGPFFIKVTIKNHGRGISKVFDTSAKAC